MQSILIPIRTAPGNPREHYMARAKRVRAERYATAWMLEGCAVPFPIVMGAATGPGEPLLVRLTRISPRGRLDEGDNLAQSMKAIRDQIAEWLGVNDRYSEVVRYSYAQERGKQWGVRVEIA